MKNPKLATGYNDIESNIEALVYSIMAPDENSEEMIEGIKKLVEQARQERQDKIKLMIEDIKTLSEVTGQRTISIVLFEKLLTELY